MSNRNFDFSAVARILKAQNTANYYNRQQTVIQGQTGLPYTTELLAVNPQSGNFDADSITSLHAGQQAYYFKGVPITTVLAPQTFTTNEVANATPPTPSTPFTPSTPLTSSSSPPSAPVITSIIPGDEQVFVYFTQASEGSSPITNYLYSLDNGATFTAVDPPQTTSPLDISGLTNGTTYPIKIQAVNSIGTSTSSNGISGTPSNVLPDPPVLIYYVPGDGSAYIYFTPGASGGSSISSYQYSLDSGITYQNVASTGATSPVLITGLTNGTPANITLRAVSVIGPSATDSNALSVTPVATVAATSYLEYDPNNTSSYPGTGTTIYDASGSYGAFNGTLVNGITYLTGTGISRNVLRFNGSNQYITFPSFNFGTAITVSTWVYPFNDFSINTLIANGHPLAGLTPGFKFFWNSWNSTSLSMNIESGDNSNPTTWGSAASPGNVVKLNEWQYLTYIFDVTNSTCIFFRNAQPVASGLVYTVANTVTNGAAFNIGAMIGPASYYMNAQFGYIKIFNVLLNAGQIEADYNNSKASFGL